jgi:hypothetical protein
MPDLHCQCQHDDHDGAYMSWTTELLAKTYNAATIKSHAEPQSGQGLPAVDQISVAMTQISQPLCGMPCAGKIRIRLLCSDNTVTRCSIS